MGDMGDAFRAMKEFGQQKRAQNLAKSTAILRQRGVAFESFNNGIQLRVGPYDFWPSTGLYMHRATKRTGRGVFNLLKESEVKNNG